MDTAVALVQAYLRVNGYFTVSEYPVLEATRGGGYQTATDLDILAVRFPGAGSEMIGGRAAARAHAAHLAPDPALGVAAEQPDMLVGEVKEGRAMLNAGATDAGVLRAVLVRFGCCSREEAPAIVERLIRQGWTSLPTGHRLRLIAFGSTVEANGGRYTVLSLGHILEFLRQYLRDHWEVLRHAESKDPAFGFLVMAEKALRGTQ